LLDFTRVEDIAFNAYCLCHRSQAGKQKTCTPNIVFSSFLFLCNRSLRNVWNTNL